MAEGGNASASSYSTSDVNEEYLKSLMEMGIHRDDARQALKFVDNRSLEDALAVIFGETPSFSVDSSTSASGAPVEQSTQISYESNVIPTETDPNMMTYKMLFIINGSLAMSSGKLAAQVAHCAIDLYDKIQAQRLQSINFWRMYGQRKIVVRANSLEELIDIEQRAAINKTIVTSLIQDAGRTEIASGSITCVGLYGTDNQLDPMTGHLKLLKGCADCFQQQKTKKNQNIEESQTKVE